MSWDPLGVQGSGSTMQRAWWGGGELVIPFFFLFLFERSFSAKHSCIVVLFSSPQKTLGRSTSGNNPRRELQLHVLLDNLGVLACPHTPSEP